VAARVGGGLTADQVENELTSRAPANTVLLDITVVDPSAQRALTIARAIDSIFPTIVDRIEKPAGGGVSPVRVTVTRPPTLAVSQVSPRTGLDIGLAGGLGLLIGVLLALVREALDNTIKSPDDLQRTTGRGVMGVIPWDPDTKTHPLIVGGADWHRAEAFRQLRTSLRYVSVDDELRSVVVTSAVPEEGKTTITCNLAIALAQAGVRVLLVEADLRRPRIPTYLGLDNAVGLSSVLVNAVSLRDALQTWGPCKMDVLLSGPSPTNPSEMLGSRAMGDLLRVLEQHYDLVLIDTPPLLPVTDGAVLAGRTGGVIFVVAHGHTNRDQATRSAEMLSNVSARLLGGVINMAPAADEGPRYAYGYGRYAASPTATATPAGKPDSAGRSGQVARGAASSSASPTTQSIKSARRASPTDGRGAAAKP
jgi:capsular exopolysaccharide synthesis family protein